MLRLWIIPLVFVYMSGAAPMQAQESGGEIRHTVGAGDTLSSIALAYGVTVDEILALNGLNLEALLQLGQSLLIATAQPGESAETSAAEGAEAESPPAANEAGSGGDAKASDAPIERPLPAIAAPAPIAEADAPLFDPTHFHPGICFDMFRDDNQNGVLDPGEGYLAGGDIILKDQAGNEETNYTTDGLSEPVCIEDLAPRAYIIKAAAPAGYGLTSSPSLHVNLEDGGRVNVHFGLKQGLEAFAVPTVNPRKVEDAPAPLPDGGSLLMELSGLFVFGLAGIVLFGGLFAALLMRIR